MFVNKSRNPSASEILSQLFLNKELRSRVLTTLGLLLLVRLGIYIPMPGIDRVAFKSFIDQGGQLIGFLDIFYWRRNFNSWNIRVRHTSFYQRINYNSASYSFVACS